jgi:hypothetical protein
VLTSGFEQTEEARARIAAVARTVYAWAMTRPDPRE